MAYMSQERKKELATEAKKVLKKYGVKATFGVRNHSTIVCNIKSGPIDFIGNHNRVCSELSPQFKGVSWSAAQGYMDINPYHFKRHFSGKALAFLTEIMACLNKGNHDRSDIMTDYFDVGWYVDVNIGKYDKPYEIVE